MKNENILQSFNLTLKQHSDCVQHKFYPSDCSCSSISRTQPFYVAIWGNRKRHVLRERELRGEKILSESENIDFSLSSALMQHKKHSLMFHSLTHTLARVERIY